jgi:drug/metabolite transporter (DMT)-like permease
VATSTTTRTARVGTTMALASAAAFGSSGPMAKALLDTGWTAGAVVLVRLAGAAVLLVIGAAVLLRGRWRPRPAALRTIVLYGVVAMAGVQLAFFNAVRTLDVAVALMIEYLAPLLVLGWTSLRNRAMPRRATLLGAALALIGLAFVLDLSGTQSIDPVGAVWALVAAVCLGAFFVISEQQHADLPPVVMAAGGTVVGAVVIALAGATGVVPLAFSSSDTLLAGAGVSWAVPAAWLAVVATVAAYLSGIGGIVRLGTRAASFVALTEVLFAVLVAWALLAELPTLTQLLGGAAIVAGIVLIRRRQLAGQTPAPTLPLESPV